MKTENITISGILLEEKLNTLKKVGVDDSGWLTYYLDETSGEKWIKDYPNSEMHGGGSPILRLLDKFPWE